MGKSWENIWWFLSNGIMGIIDTRANMLDDSAKMWWVIWENLRKIADNYLKNGIIM